MRSGYPPDPGSTDQVAISEGFATAHRFSEGSTFRVLINGADRLVHVTGVALSPEFIYTIGPGDLMPDERRFGIVWMGEKALAASENLDGAFSNVLLKLVPGTPETRVIETLDRLLAPYGASGAYVRKDQQSYAFLDAEMQQLQALAFVLPPIFMLVAAYLVNMTLSRLISLEREQIGLLKALGYSSWSIAVHYIEFVSLIALIGTLIGYALGTWLGNEITALYARSYHFPFLIFSRDPGLYVVAAAITIGAAVAGAIKAVRDVAWLPPAVAMTPPAPPLYRRDLASAIEQVLHFRQSAVMISRHLIHRPIRSLGGIIGVALAGAILVGSLWSFDSIEYMIDFSYHQSTRQDASINFLSPKPISALYAIGRMPGILRAEPYRNVGVKMRLGQFERRVNISGLSPGAQLTHVLDANSNLIPIPSSGIVVTKALAGLLRATTGSLLEVELLEGDRRTVHVPISAIVEGYLGLGAYMDMGELNRLVGESAMISGVNVSLDPLQQDRLFAALKSTPSASFIALLRVSLQRFRATLAENLVVQMITYVGFASVLAFGVVYNFARISLSEQGREMASLRVLGFTKREVSGLLLTELAVVVVIAQPVGWILGYLIGWGMATAMATELYRIPFIMPPHVFAYSSIVVVAAAIASALIVRRRIDRLDMIAVLKTRE